MQHKVFAGKGFTHILGLSPAIVPGSKEAGDSRLLESCGIFKDGHTCYWYFSDRGDSDIYPKGYRLGVATAPGMGNMIHKTVELIPKTRVFKVVSENPNSSAMVSTVKGTAIVGR